MNTQFKTMLVLVVFCLVVALSAAAQSDALRALYDASAAIPTNVEGIHTFPAPPPGFNALTASDEELAMYGFPFRPDKAADPQGYAVWARVMRIPARRLNDELKPRRAQSGPARLVASPTAAPVTEHPATSATSNNWSGVVNTLPLTKYSSTKSFKVVNAEFTVPVAQQAFNGSGGNICDGGWDLASVWVGQDGMNQDHVFQGGIDSGFYCNGGTTATDYSAWVEWYPAGSVTVMGINPGDDIYVNVQNTSSTAGVVFIEDMTLQAAVSYHLTAPKINGHTYALIANEAEYIVERPGGDSTPTGLYPLANYLWSIWDFTRSEAYTGTFYYPGATTASTYDISMTDDLGSQIISSPYIDKGLQNLFVSDAGCAQALGCVP
jgi:hypothetical protein